VHPFRLGNGYFLDWIDTPAHGYSALDRYDVIVNNARTDGLHVLGELSNEAWNGWLSMWQANNAEISGGNGDNSIWLGNQQCLRGNQGE
jgi:hypothetical protein